MKTLTTLFLLLICSTFTHAQSSSGNSRGDEGVVPVLSFHDFAQYVDEGDTLSVRVDIQYANLYPTSVDVAVLYLSGVSTAGIDTDYIFTSPTTITFPAYSNVPIEVKIPAVDDLLTEGYETFILELVNPTNFALIYGNSQDSVVIVDNDGLGISAITNSAISIFPNPVSDHFYLNGIEKNSSVAIMNATGQLIQTCTANAPREFDASELAPGIYFINIESAGRRTFLKLAKR